MSRLVIVNVAIVEKDCDEYHGKRKNETRRVSDHSLAKN
jgi:hypothetical protein